MNYNVTEQPKRERTAGRRRRGHDVYLRPKLGTRSTEEVTLDLLEFSPRPTVLSREQ